MVGSQVLRGDTSCGIDCDCDSDSTLAPCAPVSTPSGSTHGDGDGDGDGDGEESKSISESESEEEEEEEKDAIENKWRPRWGDAGSCARANKDQGAGLRGGREGGRTKKKSNRTALSSGKSHGRLYIFRALLLAPSSIFDSPPSSGWPLPSSFPSLCLPHWPVPPSLLPHWPALLDDGWGGKRATSLSFLANFAWFFHSFRSVFTSIAR